MQEGLFPKKLRIYRFMMARLPLHRFFKHQSLSIVHSWAIWSFWSTLKPKYWQYFSLFYSRGFWGLYNLDYKVTKLQSIEPLFWKAVLYIKPAEPSSIILVLILFLGKTTKEILLMQMTNWEDKGTAGPIHYPMWVWNFENKCYWYVVCWWFITAIIWNVCLLFPQKRLVV